jgi:hypothetical protein
VNLLLYSDLLLLYSDHLLLYSDHLLLYSDLLIIQHFNVVVCVIFIVVIIAVIIALLIQQCPFALNILCLALLDKVEISFKGKLTQLATLPKQIGLKINANKTKVMLVNPKPKRATHIHDVDLESVIVFNYLGSTISSDGNIVVEIKQRIGKANAAYKHIKTSGDSKSIAQRPKSGYINHVSGHFSSMGLKHVKQTREKKSSEKFVGIHLGRKNVEC